MLWCPLCNPFRFAIGFVEAGNTLSLSTLSHQAHAHTHSLSHRATPLQATHQERLLQNNVDQRKNFSSTQKQTSFAQIEVKKWQIFVSLLSPNSFTMNLKTSLVFQWEKMWSISPLVPASSSSSDFLDFCQEAPAISFILTTVITNLKPWQELSA